MLRLLAVTIEHSHTLTFRKIKSCDEQCLRHHAGSAMSLLSFVQLCHMHALIFRRPAPVANPHYTEFSRSK
jgi:hypothetical protein